MAHKKQQIKDFILSGKKDTSTDETKIEIGSILDKSSTDIINIICKYIHNRNFDYDLISIIEHNKEISDIVNINIYSLSLLKRERPHREGDIRTDSKISWTDYESIWFEKYKNSDKKIFYNYMFEHHDKI